MIEFARGGFYVSSSVGSGFDSNVYGNSSEVSDISAVFTPEAGYKRDAGIVALTTRVGTLFERFAEQTRANSVDPFLEARVKWGLPEDKSTGVVSVSLRRTSQVNEFVSDRTESNDASVTGQVQHFYAEKLGYGVRGAFSNQAYTTGVFSSVRVLGVGFDSFYQYSPKLDFFSGIGLRRSSSYDRPGGGPAIDSDDFQVSVGARGDLFSKITGRVGFGFVRRTFRSVLEGAQSGLSIDTALSWRPDEETSVSFDVSRDFDTSPDEQSVQVFRVGVSAGRRLFEKLSVSGGLSFVDTAYTTFGSGATRQDEAYEIRAGTGWAFTALISGSVSISYLTADSDRVFSVYDRTRVGVSLSVLF